MSFSRISKSGLSTLATCGKCMIWLGWNAGMVAARRMPCEQFCLTHTYSTQGLLAGMLDAGYCRWLKQGYENLAFANLR